MQTGIAHSSPWTPTLDGILAAELWHQLKPSLGLTEPALDNPDPPDLDLPLARCTPTAGPWHWAATSGWPDPIPSSPDVHHWTGRLDHRHIEHLTAAALPKVLSDRQGRYRARRMPLITTPCRTLTWSAIGNPIQIRSLLDGITSIGKKRSQGEGVVLEWMITPRADLSAFEAAHLSPTGTLARPCPPACLQDNIVSHGGRGLAAVRPPSMHPSRMHELNLPAPIQ